MLIMDNVAIDHPQPPSTGDSGTYMEANRVSAEVHLARRVKVGDLHELPYDVLRRLGDDERSVCLVSVGSSYKRYTLIVDTTWLDLASTAERVNHDLVDDLPLPRSVVDAVVAGWPEDWSSHDARSGDGPSSAGPSTPRRRTNVWWSDDGIPHVDVSPN
jgi:hypothetical protein